MSEHLRLLVRNIRKAKEAGQMSQCRGCKQHYWKWNKDAHAKCGKVKP